MPGPKRTDFTVSGKGMFPTDMLRYDECFPRDPQSVMNIEPESRCHRPVHLGTHRYGGPTKERWASFGWVVIN
jgi:hypothetical protein